MSTVHDIFKSLHVEHISYNTDFPQVFIEFSLKYSAHDKADLGVGCAADGHTYYIDGDSLDLREMLTAHPHLGELSASEAVELVSLVDDRLSEVYLDAAQVLEHALIQAQEKLLAAANG